MKYALSIIFFLSLASFSYCNVASFSGTSHTIMLDNALIYMDGYQVNFIFTTYDVNRYNYPYYYDTQNSIIYFPTTSFIRDGNKYFATVELLNGGFETFWADYQKWQIVIQNRNDSDGDGIPDLSDLSESKAMPWIPLLLLVD